MFRRCLALRQSVKDSSGVSSETVLEFSSRMESLRHQAPPKLKELIRQKRRPRLLGRPSVPYTPSITSANPTELPKLWMDWYMGAEYCGTTIIQLFDNLAETSANRFRRFCSGEDSNGYYNTQIVRARRGLYIQGGKGVKFSAAVSQRKSAMGKPFLAEDLSLTHCCPGIVSMLCANAEHPIIGTEFIITLAPCKFLDGHAQPIGKVVHGMSSLYRVMDKANIPGKEGGSIEPTITIKTGEV